MINLIQACLSIPGINGAMGLPILIEGPPGAGKSNIIAQIAEAEGLHLETVILSVREPQDVVGIPIISDGCVKIEPPSWCKRLVEKGSGILFFDELACAAPSVQAAALRIICERVVGDVQLPKNVRIVSATNSSDDAAGGWEIAPPLANRFVHYKWAGPKINDWVDWLLGSGTITKKFKPIDEDTWTNSFAKAKGMMASFLSRKAGMLGPNVPKDAEQASRAWPSPRTWEMATRALAWCKAANFSHIDIIKGLVGEGAVKEFLTFEFYNDLPDPIDLITDKVKYVPDNRLDRTIAVLSGLSSYAISVPTHAPKVWRLLRDISVKAGARDTMVAPARSLIKSGLMNSTEAMEALVELGPMVKNLGIDLSVGK